MSYLDNIKAIATELASMSPRTQIELVKLCKDLCIQTKNYLVAFDETTLPALDARIEALETLTNNLSSELNIAEGNITANANAIATIQDTITTIQTALSNVYTKTQIDTMLASYYSKSDINTMFGSYYTKGEVNTLLGGYYPKADTYNKTEVNTLLSGKASLSSNNTFTGENKFNEAIEIASEASFFMKFNYNGENTSLEDELDNIYNDLVNKSNKLYQHNFIVCGTYDSEQHSISIGMNIITTKSTQLTYSEIKNYIENNTIFSTYIGVEVSGAIGTNNYFGLSKYNNYLQLLYKDGEYDFTSDDTNWNELVFKSLQDYTITPL